MSPLRLVTAFVLLSLPGFSDAHAVPTGGLSAAPPPATRPPSGQKTVSHCPLAPGDIEAEAYYKAGMGHYVAGRLRLARSFFMLVITRFGESRYAAPAKLKLIAIDKNPAAEPRGRDTSGRSELIVGNSLIWSGLGTLFPTLLRGDDGIDQAMLWSALGSGVAAGVGSYLLTRDVAIPDGYAHLHHFAQLWGAANGFAIQMLIDPTFESATIRSTSGAVLGGAGAGLVSSLLFKDGMSIPRGEAEFVTSAPIWASMAGVSLSILLWGEDIRPRSLIGMAFGLGNAGLVAGALFRPPWTKTRLRYINLITYGGVLLGNAITASSDTNDIRVYGGVSLATLAVGIGIGILVTRGMPNARGGDRQASAGLPALVSMVDGKLEWGIPLPRVAPRRYGHRLALGAELDLFAGTF